MQNTYFPMFVDISKKRIVVIGAGTIAVRRIKTLLLFTDQIVVVAPDICEELEKLVNEKNIAYIRKTFEEKDLQNAEIVLAATDKHEVNARIVAYCREHRIPVNTSDQKDMCDFYFPSVVCKENIVIGIGSGGKSPGKVKEIRKKIEKTLDE